MHGTVAPADKPLAQHTASFAQHLHPEENWAPYNKTVPCYSRSGYQGDDGCSLTWLKLPSPVLCAETVLELAASLLQVELAWGCSRS